MSEQTVIVGCKLPNGLEIRLGDGENAKRVTLKGTNSTDIIGGHGITEVNKEFWDAWYENHLDFAPVEAGLIFANDKYAKTKSEAEEKVDNESGFEGINPNKPGKDIKKFNPEDDK